VDTEQLTADGVGEADCCLLSAAALCRLCCCPLSVNKQPRFSELDSEGGEARNGEAQKQKEWASPFSVPWPGV
jgi:hypothetical protein